MLYEIETPHNRYRVRHETGNVVARVVGTKLERMANDGSWRVLGCLRVRQENLWLDQLVAIPDLIARADTEGLTAYLFANGKPRYAVIDQDHGILRRWGEPIVRLRLVTP
jgi:hypothetical protein